MPRHILLESLSSDFDQFVSLPANGSRGGILIAWKSAICQVLCSRVDSFYVSIHCVGHEGRNGGSLGYMALRMMLRSWLSCKSCVTFVPYVLGLGLCPGTSILLIKRMMGRFRRLIDDTELQEIPLLGRK